MAATRSAVWLSAAIVMSVVSGASAAQPAGIVSGVASWYGGGERLNPHNAMGRRVDPRALEAAMWDVPLGQHVRVTDPRSGRSVVVRITDRGPARRLSGRVIDLSRAAFARLAPLRQGLVRVTVEPLASP